MLPPDSGTTGDIPTLDRYVGCLLGGAVGDALGAAVEFESLAAIRAHFGPGGIRDYAPAYGRLGAITGNILGALLGRGAIPARWLDSLELREEIEQIATDLCLHFGASNAPEPDTDGDKYPGW